MLQKLGVKMKSREVLALFLCLNVFLLGAVSIFFSFCSFFHRSG